VVLVYPAMLFFWVKWTWGISKRLNIL